MQDIYIEYRRGKDNVYRLISEGPGFHQSDLYLGEDGKVHTGAIEMRKALVECLRISYGSRLFP